MRFKCSITINRPIDAVAQLFADPENLKEYQDGFIRKELITGNSGESGAVSQMYYKMGNREMELTETIIANRLPNEFQASYHHRHMDNTMKCLFTPVSENQTRYDTEIEYTAFRGFIPKMVATLFPGVFKKQVQRWLDNFKVFAEKSGKN